MVEIFEIAMTLLNSLFNYDYVGPSTIRCKFDMFLNWIIVFLPAVQIGLTEVTCHVVQARTGRLIEKARSGELEAS